jgi:hypothetical protein
MKRNLIALIASALFLAGCASLNLRPTDGIGMTVAKVGARVLLVVPTLGVSELSLAMKRGDERYRVRDAELSASTERWRKAALEATSEADRELAIRNFDAERGALERLHHPSVEPRSCHSRVIGSQLVTPCD